MNYIERMKQERDELLRKANAANNAVVTNKFNMNETQLAMLRAQHACMIAYCTILSERIEYEVNKNV